MSRTRNGTGTEAGSSQVEGLEMRHADASPSQRWQDCVISGTELEM